MYQEASTNLDQDLSNSRLGKYNNNKEQVRQWIYQVLNIPQSDRIQLNQSDLLEILKDGSILCQLANVALPGSARYKASKMPFVQMENISNFLTAAKKIGVPEDELFQTIDLYEAKDPYQIILSIQSFSRQAHKTNSSIPLIGPQIATKRTPPPRPVKPKNLGDGKWSTFEYGYMHGANQNSEKIVFGGRRDITGNR